MREAQAVSTADGAPNTGDAIGVVEYGPFSTAALARYALVSGDDNPLHLDLAVAQAAGFAANPVQGMLMLACFEPYLMNWRKDLFIARLSAKFLRPVFSGESIRLSGRVLRVRQAELTLRLTARNGRDEMVILAEAAALIPSQRSD
ncbi:MAG TPA: MaoC family dehydratase [Methylocella sp.]|nr:MaoC family dehydratase [Methylocella sp.]